MQTDTLYSFTILGQPKTAGSIAEASAVWSATRDRLGFGYSAQASTTITRFGLPVGEISYNGKVWPVGHMAKATVDANADAPIFNPFA